MRVIASSRLPCSLATSSIGLLPVGYCCAFCPYVHPAVEPAEDPARWGRQCHGEVNPDFGMSHADASDGYLTAQCETRSITEEDLRTWTPASSARPGRKRKE
jgi:hypothetical protein